VVAEETTEEAISQRRRQATQPKAPRQLELVPVKPVYAVEDTPLPKVADPGPDTPYPDALPPNG
jgi:hypothetical protein